MPNRTLGNSVPEDELEGAIRFTKAKTKREAIVRAVAGFNRRRMAELVQYAGTCPGLIAPQELQATRRQGWMLRPGGDPTVRARVEAVLTTGQARWCPRVQLELWNSASGQQEQKGLQDFARTFPELPIDQEVWQAAYDLARRARAQGVTAPATDVISPAATAPLSGSPCHSRECRHDTATDHDHSAYVVHPLTNAGEIAKSAWVAPLLGGTNSAESVAKTR